MLVSMHLCVVIANTCPLKACNLEIGGAEKQVFRLLPEYEDQLDRLSVITKYTTYIPRKNSTTIRKSFDQRPGILKSIINHIFTHKLRVISPITYFLYVSLNLLKIHRKNRIDFLNTHLMDSSYYPIILFAKSLGIKTIYKPPSLTMFSQIFRVSIKDNLFKRVLNKINLSLMKKEFLLIDFMQAINEEIKTKLINLFDYPKHRIVLIPNGIKVDNFKNLYNPNALAFGHVGRLERIKNVPLIIEAFSRVVKDYPQFKLLLFGDGSERKKIEESLRKLDLQEKSMINGFESDYTKIYSSFGVFIIASFSEGISNSLLEAMAVGIPIIASKNEGNLAVIKDGVEGLLFDPRSAIDLEEKMRLIIENSSLRDKMRANAFVKIQNDYDIKKIVNRLILFMQSKLR